MLSGVSWFILGFLAVMLSIAAFADWLGMSQLTHAPPINAYVYLESTNGSSYIYFMRIFTSPSQYWDMHNTLTIYGVEAYTGNATVDCVVKPQLPITIRYNYAYGPGCPVATLVLYCPTPISNATVKTNNGAYPLN